MTNETEQKITLLDAFKKIIETKQKYADDLTVQLKERLGLGTLTQMTAQHHTMSLRNLEAAVIKLDEQDYPEALHFFSRACANLGEFIGRAAHDKKAS